MNLLQIASLLIVLAASFGTINYFVLKLPSSIGILLVALLSSITMLGVDQLVPDLGLADQVRHVVTGIDFSEALMEGMLGLLLFAGALHVKVSDLKEEWAVVLIMATVGVALSTLLVGLGFSYVTGMPILLALIFGAVIAPTDPVAVLGVLRAANLDKRLETKIAGESLFNDGVGYVVFLVLVGIAYPAASGGHGAEAGNTYLEAGRLFLQEAGGGAALGLVLGFIVFQIMRRIDDPSLEVLITLALAFGGYELCVALHVSAPIMAVCAGLLIGDIGTRHGMSETTQKYVEAFWHLIDEILNAVLFLLIGFEVFAVQLNNDFILPAILAILLSLGARLIAVTLPVLALSPVRSYVKGTIPIMTWGGLKGGISVALALSLPDSEWKPLILTVTYCVVIFSILVQGLTIAPLSRRVADPQPVDPEGY
ncbi:sodium:proton antiporter [Pseudooceanicola sp. HF7]|uniref:cation:proton antiporter n=1 Tax=Pseudooceanicola sp. HF7 TaxID=2721560 RepID=UPI0014308D96|nr:sodium:proton antiporter [Pseudooceanicola sp. HF7]NIZ09852.1 sodium:proton antiporter [Pseudooceanicola sp. HF7]